MGRLGSVFSLRSKLPAAYLHLVDFPAATAGQTRVYQNVSIHTVARVERRTAPVEGPSGHETEKETSIPNFGSVRTDGVMTSIAQETKI